MKTLKLAFFIFMLLFIRYSGFAQTEVAGGTITGSTIWTKSGSPYNINGDILIPDGSVLTIEPGVQVNIQGEYYIRIEGGLKAVGSEDQRIGFSAANSYWKGLKIVRSPGNDSTLLKYVTINRSNASGIAISNTDSILIDHCVFVANYSSNGGALSISNSTVTISGCNFEGNRASEGSGNNNNGGALYISASTVTCVNNLLFGCRAYRYGGAGFITGNSTIKLINNTFVDNVSTGTYGGDAYGGAFYVYQSNVKSYNNIYWNNGAQYGTGIYYQYATGYHSHDAFMAVSGYTAIGNQSSTITYSGGSYGSTCKSLSAANSEINGPNFKDLSADDYSLTGSSLRLIGNGDTTSISGYLPAFDLAKENRILDNSIEIGAYELNYSKIVSTVTSVSQGNGNILPVGDSTIYYFDVTDYTITPGEGEKIVSVVYNGVSIVKDLVDKGTYFTYRLDSVITNSTLKVVFTQPFTVTASASGSGSISPGGDSIVNFFDVVIYTLTPNTGEIILSAQYNGTDIKNMLTDKGSYYNYQLDSVTTNGNLIVEFSEDKTITASAGEHGTISPQGNIVSDYGQSHEFEFTPNEGYVVSKILVNNIQVPFIGYSYTLDSVISNMSVHVEFEKFNGKLCFYPDRDAYIYNKELYPDYAKNNYGETTLLQLFDSEYNARDFKQTLLHFSGIDNILSELSLTSLDTIESAKLKLFYSSAASRTHTGDNSFKTFWYNEEWIENSVTWNNAPAIPDNELYVEVPKSTSGTQDYSIDLTDLFIGQYDNAKGTVGFRLILTSGADYSRQEVIVASKENEDSSLWPMFIIKLKGTYMVTSSVNGDGTISPAGDSVVNTGASIVYTITPNPGKQITAAEYNGASIISNMTNHGNYYTYQLNDINQDGTLQVTFSDIANAISNQANETLNIVPNPSTGIVNIPLKQNTNKASMFIYSLTGSLVYSNTEFFGGTVDLSDFQTGIYIIKINSQGMVSTAKLIIE